MSAWVGRKQRKGLGIGLPRDWKSNAMAEDLRLTSAGVLVEGRRAN
jgi:hypothetical protein